MVGVLICRGCAHVGGGFGWLLFLGLVGCNLEGLWLKVVVAVVVDGVVVDVANVYCVGYYILSCCLYYFNVLNAKIKQLILAFL